jgi:hypothetical protein
MFGKSRSKQYINHEYTGQMIYGGTQYHHTNQGLSNRQPNPYQPNLANVGMYPYQQQNPYFVQQMQPFGYNNYPSGPTQQSYQYSTKQYPPNNAQFLFQNPLQPMEEPAINPYGSANPYPNMNPYPKQNWAMKQPGGMQSIMNSFKSQDGTVDINKMVNTAGQMMNAVSQVSSLVKGFGGIFKI